MKENNENEVKIGGYVIHPLCLLFPYMDEQTSSILKEDMRKHGQRDTIKRYQGEILDGKNRLRQLRDLGIDPKIEDLPEDTNPIAYIKAVGLCRRDLNSVLRFEIAQKIEEYRLSQLKEEEQEKRKEIKESTKAEVKEKLPLNENEIEKIVKDARTTKTTAKKILRVQKKAKEDPKIQRIYEDMKEGKITVDTGHKKVIGTTIKHKPRIIKEPTKDELKEELEGAKFEIERLKNKNSNLIKQKEKLIAFINKKGLWEEAREELGFPKKVPSFEPTIAEVRKSQL